MSVEVILKYTPGTCLKQNFVERNNEARLINQKNIQIKSKKKQNSSILALFNFCFNNYIL